MPELPEVETMVRGIRPAIESAVVLQLLATPCQRKPLSLSPSFKTMQRRITQRCITQVRRLAKRVVLEFDNGNLLVFEPRMTGLVLLSDPPTVEHLRFEFQLQRGNDCSSFWIWDRRGLGTLTLYTPAEFEQHFGDGKLGPDALEISLEILQRRLQQTDRPVKVALLDQKLLAGVGNLYASEILHESGIHPELPGSQLRRPQVQKLHAAMLRILQEAIAYEGSTLNDGTYRNALNKDGSYQNKHRVYAKAGEQCITCGQGTILRIVQAQRSTFFCPRCQRYPRSR